MMLHLNAPCGNLLVSLRCSSHFDQLSAGHCGCRYIMDSKLAVLSTTNHLYNASLYDSLTHESLVRACHFLVLDSLAASLFASLYVICSRTCPYTPHIADTVVLLKAGWSCMQQTACDRLQVSWQRVRVANALAVSGEEWVSYLDYLNSGTYNNQCAPLLSSLHPHAISLAILGCRL